MYSATSRGHFSNLVRVRVRVRVRVSGHFSNLP